MSDHHKYVKIATIAAGVALLGYGIYKSSTTPEIKEGEEKEEGKVEVGEGFFDKNPDQHVELKRDEAIKRAKQIINVHYDLVLAFAKDEALYDGYIRITFTLSDTTEDLFIEFRGHSVSWIKINGKDISKLISMNIQDNSLSSVTKPD